MELPSVVVLLIFFCKGFDINRVLGTDIDCPFLCSCESTSGYDVTCNNVGVFPGNIPEVTTSLTIDNSIFETIPVYAFEYAPNLQTMRFRNVTVRVFKACSFAEVSNVTSIEFENCDISEIQGNTFSDIVNVTTIKFSGSKIREISSYAFHMINNIREILFHHNKITAIRSLAFQDLTNVGRLEFIGNSIDLIRVEGFSKLTNFGTFLSKSTNITELQCNKFENIIASGGHVTISDTRLTCDCKLAWLWVKYSSFSHFSNDSTNLCIGSQEKMVDIDVDRVCPDERSRAAGCPQVMPSTVHMCFRGLDDMDPITKVTFPTYFRSTTGKSGENRVARGNIIATVMSGVIVYITSNACL